MEEECQDPEVIGNVVCQAAVMVKDVTDAVNQLVTHSSWFRLRRAVAWILKFKKFLCARSKIKQKAQKVERKLDNEEINGIDNFLTLNDLHEAEMAVLKHVQASAYPEEIKVLEKQTKHAQVNHTSSDGSKPSESQVKTNSHICKLRPFMMEGVLRVGGRLRLCSHYKRWARPYIQT